MTCNWSVSCAVIYCGSWWNCHLFIDVEFTVDMIRQGNPCFLPSSLVTLLTATKHFEWEQVAKLCDTFASISSCSNHYFNSMVITWLSLHSDLFPLTVSQSCYKLFLSCCDMGKIRDVDLLLISARYLIINFIHFYFLTEMSSV